MGRPHLDGIHVVVGPIPSLTYGQLPWGILRPSSLSRAIATMTLAAALAAACGADLDVALPDTVEEAPVDPSAPTTPAPNPRPTPTPAPEPPGRAELPDDILLEPGPRLAVQTPEQQIFTMLGDGSNQVPLTAADEGRFNSLPTWSLDANRLAWVATDPASGDASVRSARFDGTAWADQRVSAAPFHLAWDPTGSQIATLSPSRNGVLELGVVDVDRNPSYRAIDDGAPFWFSWNPDADGFLVHVSNLRLDFVPIDGPSQVLERFPGRFQAPIWLNGAVELIYADEVNDEEFLVVAGVDGSGRRALVTYDGYLQFVVAPESGLVALQAIDPSLAPVPDVITASHSQVDEFEDIVDPIPRTQLTLMATFGGDPFILYPGPNDFEPRPVIAFYWSPDGSSLAWLLEIAPGDGDCASETATYEWQFWTGDAFVIGPRFLPTATFACDYVPQFDQFDQAATFWSPDSALFAYSGTEPGTDNRGIWTFPVSPNAAPSLIAEGEIAVWSPDTAGAGGQSDL